MILYEVVVRVEAAPLDEGARRGEEVGALGFGHIEVYGLEEAATDEAAAEVGEDGVLGALPLLDVEGQLGVV